LVQILAIVPLIASTGAEEVFAVARRRGAGHVVQKQITICTHKWPVLKDEGLDCKENRVYVGSSGWIQMRRLKWKRINQQNALWLKS